MPVIKEAFDSMTDFLVNLSTKNESLKHKEGSYDKNCLEESKAKLLKQFNDKKRANLIMSRMEKQVEKQN